MTVPVFSSELGFVPIVPEMLDRRPLAGDDGVHASGVELARALTCHATSSTACVLFWDATCLGRKPFVRFVKCVAKSPTTLRFWFGEDKEIADHLMTRIAELGELDREKFGVQK
ncbi:MAG: hypothetical protein IPN69_14355 [Acidobacteria bacterium]|nr:hypothetical protein [Acidobacteriota bacterium]